MAATLKSAADWFVARPWITQAMMGLLWIYMAIVALGKGQDFAVMLAFYGMLVWALTESDKRAYQGYLANALEGWKETIAAWEKDRG